MIVRIIRRTGSNGDSHGNHNKKPELTYQVKYKEDLNRLEQAIIFHSNVYFNIYFLFFRHLTFYLQMFF